MRSALLAVGLAWALPSLPHAATCRVESGPQTAALVELYTSESCARCPPADRWLSSLAGRGYEPSRLVSIALHVDYWDYIGWKDASAKRELSLRQRKLTQLQRLALAYTPRVMLQGREFRDWGTSAFDDALTRINARPAAARISLELTGMAREALRVRVRAEPLAPGDAALYLAAYGNRPETRVTAGENRGRFVRHDRVVLEWQGPVALPGGPIEEERVLPLLPGAVPTNSGAVAFVQDRRTAEVLQVLMLPACP